MAETTRRKFAVFLPQAFVEIEADEIQFAGPTMIFWRDSTCVAQFTNWIGWAEQSSKGEKPKPELAVVTNLRPPPEGSAA